MISTYASPTGRPLRQRGTSDPGGGVDRKPQRDAPGRTRADDDHRERNRPGRIRLRPGPGLSCDGLAGGDHDPDPYGAGLPVPGHHDRERQPGPDPTAMTARARWDVAPRPLCRAAFLLPPWRTKSSPWIGSRRRITGSPAWCSSAGSALVYLLAFASALHQFPAAAGRARPAPGAPLPRGYAVPGRAQPVPPGATPTGWLRGWCGVGGVVLAAATLLGLPARRAALGPGPGLAGRCGRSTSRSSTSGSASTRSGGSRSCSRRGSSPSSWATHGRRPPLPMLLLFRWLAVPGGVRRGTDQAAGRPLLAGPHLSRLPPRDPADAEPAQLVRPPPAPLVPPARGPRQLRRPAGRAGRRSSCRSRWPASAPW